MTHKPIKRFSLDGEFADDSLLIQTKETVKGTIISDMRDGGYVPLLDVDPSWTTVYDVENNKYTFLMTVHGVHVGKRRAWKVYGIMNDREVMME